MTAFKESVFEEGLYENFIRVGDVFPLHWRAEAMLETLTSGEGVEGIQQENVSVSEGDAAVELGTVCSLCGKTITNITRCRWVETINGIVQDEYGRFSPHNANGQRVFWPVGGKCLKRIHSSVQMKETSEFL